MANKAQNYQNDSIDDSRITIRSSQHRIEPGKLKVALRGVSSSENDGNEEVDNGENFIAWLKTAEKLEEPKATETKKELFQPVLPVARTEDKAPEMVVISPAGVQRYRFGKKNELPELVTPEKKDALGSTTSVAGVNGSNMVWIPLREDGQPRDFLPLIRLEKAGNGDDSSGEESDEAPVSQK